MKTNKLVLLTLATLLSCKVFAVAPSSVINVPAVNLILAEYDCKEFALKEIDLSLDKVTHLESFGKCRIGITAKKIDLQTHSIGFFGEWKNKSNGKVVTQRAWIGYVIAKAGTQARKEFVQKLMRGELKHLVFTQLPDGDPNMGFSDDLNTLRVVKK